MLFLSFMLQSILKEFKNLSIFRAIIAKLGVCLTLTSELLKRILPFYFERFTFFHSKFI